MQCRGNTAIVLFRNISEALPRFAAPLLRDSATADTDLTVLIAVCYNRSARTALTVEASAMRFILKISDSALEDLEFFRKYEQTLILVC